AKCKLVRAPVFTECRLASATRSNCWTSRIKKLGSTPKGATSIDFEKLNRIVLTVLAPVLILTGIAGFVIPQQLNPTSNATPYNLFHIAFGAIGLMLLNLKDDRVFSAFNFGFGVLSLYQVLASWVGLTPIEYFLWTPIDDFLH